MEKELGGPSNRSGRSRRHRPDPVDIATHFEIDALLRSAQTMPFPGAKEDPAGRRAKSHRNSARKAGGAKKSGKGRDTRVFLSYAREDKVWALQVEKALRVLIDNGNVELFADWHLPSGDTWKKKLSSFIRRCQVAVLLLSNDFFSSRYIIDVELPAILNKRAKGKMTVIPVLVRHCAYEISPELSELQLMNDPERPLAGVGSSELEAELTKLVRQIREISLSRKSGTKSGATSSPACGKRRQKKPPC